MIPLSAEIYDQIVSHFEFSVPLDGGWMKNERAFGFDMLQFHSRPAWQGEGRMKCVEDTETLRNLRLVSKAFHQAASRMLFRAACVTWRFNRHGEPSPTPAIKQFILEGQNGISIGAAIKNVKLDFGATYSSSTHGKSDDLFLKASAVPLEIKVSSLLIENIPAIVEKLPALRSLEVCYSSWVSEYYGDGPGLAPQVDLEIWKAMNATIVKTLTTNALGHLTELRLNLACTYDFSSLFDSLSEEMYNQLRSLQLGVTDASGPGATKDHLHWQEEEEDGDDEVPFSNLQLLYPNIDNPAGRDSSQDFGSANVGESTSTSGNEAHFFNLAARCHNLESLGFSGTQILNADLLPWYPTSQGLKTLFMSRIKISALNLITLLSPASHLPLSSSRLSHVWLEDVELTAGTWKEVFKHLMGCESLVYLSPQDLSYARGGTSLHLRVFSGRAWEDSRDIWSEDEEELGSLYRLVRKLVEKAGGRKNYPEHHNEQAGQHL